MAISNRFRISLWRWGSILAMAVIGAVVFEASLPVGWYYVRALPDPLDGYSVWFLCVAILAALLFLAFLVAESIRFRLRHIPGLLHYPPFWFSVVLGLVFALLVDILLPPLQAGVVPSWRQLDVLLPLVIVAVIAVGIRQLPWKRPARSEPDPELPATVTWHVVQEWSRREDPLTDGPDLLGHEPIMERIHDAVVRPEERAFALVGPVGSGKTSILNLLRQRLLRTKGGRRVVIAEVNCWAMPRSEDAPRVALERVISALDDFVDTLALRRLPDAYQQILSAEPTGTIAKLFSIGRTRDATEQLSGLTPLLEAIDARLLIIIEDAERAVQAFETRHLERLLWTLRDVDRVSFILSFDPERASFDYTKLCDNIERLPRITGDRVIDILAPAYEHWKTATEGYIDPLLEERKDRLGLENVTNPLVRYMRRRDGDTAAHAITDLLTTPRKLKHFIREIDQAWEALRGEVELDDLIVLTALRHGAPEAFDFIAVNAEPARSEPPRDDPIEGTAVKTVRARWDSLRKSLTKPTEVQILVDALELRQLTGQTIFAQSLPQGIHNDGPVDYLGRILAGRIPPGEIRDQEVLKDIVSWKKSRSAQMLKRLLASTPESNQYVDIWEHYDCHLSEDQLIEIATGLIADALRRLKANASINHPAMHAAWRRYTRRLGRDTKTDWLIDQIRIVLPISLGFATDLFYFWGSAENGIVSVEHRNRVRMALVEDARTSFVNVDALLLSLGPEHEYALTRLVHPPPLNEPPDPIPWDSWASLVPIIIEAAKVNEDRIVPDVAILVGDTAVGVRTGQFDQPYELKREQMVEFFGNQTHVMLEILAEYGGKHEYALAAKEEATKWIAEGRRESGDQ